MTTAQTMLYVLMLCFFVFGISIVQEFYKKTIRKDKAKLWEIQLLGLLLSAASLGSLIVMNIFRPILGILGAPLWADHLIYLIGIYILQWQADMKIIKKLTKSLAKDILLSKGLKQEQVNIILEIFDNEKENN